MADDTMYDAIAGIYDAWSVSVVEDVDFYVNLARACSGPVVELAVGTGRIAVPIARAGVRVIGVDESNGMLEAARAQATGEGVSDLLDLRQGDMRAPPVPERVPLVLIPFRSLLHMPTNEEKLRVLQAAAGLLAPGGRLVFDVFAPSREDIDETDGRWLEREPEIFERADWNEHERTLTLSVRQGGEATSFTLHWLDEPGWRSLITEAGLTVETLYGWFDGRDYDGGEDMIWVCAAALVDGLPPTGVGSQL
jgi:SAM-dependent methyltransferase